MQAGLYDLIEYLRDLKKKAEELTEKIKDIRKDAMCKIDPSKCKKDQDPDDPFEGPKECYR